MKFIHAVVYNHDEFLDRQMTESDCADWGIICDGDYIVHALYSVDNKEVLMLNDNCHSRIEDEIESFLEGIEFCGHDAVVTNVFVVMGNDEDAYNDYAVKCHLDNDEYVEVI